MNLESKICLVDELVSKTVMLKRPLVMTNGVFDVLHRGHVSYLSKAAALGYSLVVAVNNDDSVRMLGKGVDRPLNVAKDRAYVLAGLSSVTLVTIFDERTPIEHIKKVRPDIYVKGGDYDIESLEETLLVRSWGGESLAIPFVEGFSTTSLINNIRQTLLRSLNLDKDSSI